MNKTIMIGIVAVAGLALAGCTSVQVKRADPATGMRHVCIQENLRVTVPEFVTVLRDGIDRNGLSSEVYREQKPPHCEFILTYTALRSWDLGTYLSHAELRIERGGRQLASAQYHLRGKGGLSLAKWQGVETKMAPVIDELFANYRNGSPAANPAPSAATPVPAPVNVTDVHPPVAPAAVEEVAAPAPAGGGHIVTASEPGFPYTDDPAAAAKALAQGRNCASGFQLFSSEPGRNVYAASCWGSKKLLIACEKGSCREAR